MGKISTVNLGGLEKRTDREIDAAIKKVLSLIREGKTSLIVVGKRGRPTKYNAKLCKILPVMFASGESVSEVCAELGIAKDTFYNWVKLHPDFSDSYKKGIELSEAWWTKLGRRGAMGVDKVQPATWIFNMKNRFGWTDRVEQVVSTTVDAAAADMTPEDRRKKISALLGRPDEP